MISSKARSQDVLTPLVSPRNSNVGEVFVCGTGDCGQLGLGDEISEKLRPAVLSFFDSLEIIDVVAGGLHSLVLSKSGEVYSWGCNDDGALGRHVAKNTDEEMRPAKVEGLEGHHIVRIAAGDSISIALSNMGQVFAWGTFRVCRYFFFALCLILF